MYEEELLRQIYWFYHFSVDFNYFWMNEFTILICSHCSCSH